MIFKILILLSLSILFSCSQESEIHAETTESNQSNQEVREEWTISELYEHFPYDYSDTTLSNGYHISFSYLQEEGQDLIEKCLVLKKGDSLIDTLNIMGYAALHKNLGYIGADFSDYFAFINSFGSGNPHYLSLLRKKDGEKIKSGYYVDSFHEPELLVFEDQTDQKLKIFDIERNIDIDISRLTYDCFFYQLSDGLEIKEVTESYISVNYCDMDSNITQYKFQRKS